MRNALEYGMTGSYTIGGSITSEPGNKGNSVPVKAGLSARLSSCDTYGTDPCGTVAKNPTSMDANDPCLVVVPAVDYHGCTGSCSMTIEGFALIYLEPATTTSISINGCFVSAMRDHPQYDRHVDRASLGALQVPTLKQ